MATFNAGTVQADVEIKRDKLQGSVNGAIQDLRRLGTEGGQAGEQAGQQTGEGFASKLKGSLGGGLEGIMDGVKEKLSGLASSGAGLGALAGAGIGVALAAGLMTAVNLEPARAKLTAQLNLTTTESARLGGVAGQLYSHAYGESFEEVTGAIRSVVQNIDGMRDASAADLQSITGQVMSLAGAFDQDLGGVTKAVGQMLKTGLAANAQDALDIIAAGFTAGVDKAEDFLDTLNEYGGQFQKLGITGKEATGLLSQGLKAGARDADLVADAFKEFSIRAIDGSELTSSSLTKLGINAQAVTSAIAGGGTAAANATDYVLDKLRAVADPAEQAAIAVGLFGTQSEDLGAALYALDLSSAAAELGEVAGASQRVDAAMGDTAAGGLTSIGRGLELLAEDIGSELLPVLKFIITGLVELVGAIGDAISWVANLNGPVLAIAAALGIWATWSTIAAAASTAFGVAIDFVAASAKRLWTALGPIGLIAGAVAVAMAVLSGSTDDAAEATQAAEDRWGRLVGTLDQVSGAVTDATRAQITAEAQQSGTLATLEKLGISTKVFVDASAGVPGAQGALTAAVKDGTTALLAQSEAYQAVAGDLSKAGISQQEFIDAVNSGNLDGVHAKVDAYAQGIVDAGGDVTAATSVQDRFSAAIGDTTPQLATLQGIMGQAGSDASGFGKAADEAAQRARALGEGGQVAADGTTALKDAAGNTVAELSPMEAALKGASDATSALDQATQFLALTLDIASGGMISQEQAARANEAALRGIGAAQRDTADAYANLADKQQALTDLQATGTATAGQLEQANRDVASAADAVFDAQDAQSQANIAVQQTAIAQAVALAGTAAANGDLKGATDTATASLQRSKDAFIAAQPEADRLTGKAQATAEALFGIPGKVATQLTESGAINVQGAAHSTTTAVDLIPDYHNTNVNATDNASSTLNYLNSYKIADKTFRVFTESVPVSALEALHENGGHMYAADGLITGRGTSQRRKGQGGGVTWAEGITGEEFYLSMKPGMEIRNRGLASEAIAKLGGRAVWGDQTAPAAAAVPVTASTAARTVQLGDVHIGRFDDADRFFDRMAWEQVG